MSLLNTENLSTQVELERDFAPGPFGQIHVRIARPKNGQTIKTPLFLFPPTPHSGDYFKPYMTEMATDRTVVAVDTPGYGDSAGPDEVLTIGDYANSAAAAIDGLGFNSGSVDLLGYHAGGLIASELALLRPKLIRRLALPGFPFFVGEAREAAYERNATRDTIDPDGSHLLRKWNYSKVPMEAGVSLERTQEHFNDLMKSYPETWRGYHAAFTHPTEDRIKDVLQPVLLISVDGSLKEETKAAADIFPNANYVHLKGFTFGIFDLAPKVLAEESRKHLDI